MSRTNREKVRTKNVTTREKQRRERRSDRQNARMELMNQTRNTDLLNDMTIIEWTDQSGREY